VLIDCDRCVVRGLACGDCVVSVLLGAPPEGVQLDADERAAIGMLAHSGLVPPLRLVLHGQQTVAAGEVGGAERTDTPRRSA